MAGPLHYSKPRRLLEDGGLVVIIASTPTSQVNLYRRLVLYAHSIDLIGPVIIRIRLTSKKNDYNTSVAPKLS